MRELRNVIERALILETTDEIQPASLPDFQVEARLHKSAAPKMAGNESLDDLVTEFRAGTDRRICWNKTISTLTRPPEQLKISRHALRYRMQRLNMTLPGESGR